MLEAPFLELAYFVGDTKVQWAVDALKGVARIGGAGPKFTAPNAIGIAGEREQLVVRGGVVEVRTEGDAFCGPPGDQNAQASTFGAIAFRRFVRFLDILHPMYGAILVEYSLESPIELRRDPRSLAFKNFYVAKRAVNRQAWVDLGELLDERVYRCEVAGGVYFSMTPYFNPVGIGLPPREAHNLSAEIGKLLAASLKEGA